MPRKKPEPYTRAPKAPRHRTSLNKKGEPYSQATSVIHAHRARDPKAYAKQVEDHLRALAQNWEKKKAKGGSFWGKANPYAKPSKPLQQYESWKIEKEAEPSPVRDMTNLDLDDE
jgi:hypothetical protein